MLTKQQRYSFRNGVPKKSTSSPLFVLRYQPSDDFSAAIIVSKKINAHAVGRNRIKRAYKKALSELTEKYELRYSFVFYTRKQNNDVSPEEILSSIEQTFKKEGIITTC
jgi:ribonuclease P protein component